MAKMEKYGGNPKCIVAEPEIFSVPTSSDLDYILIGSDGIFDRISTEETCAIVMNEARAQTENIKRSQPVVQGSFEHVASMCGETVDKVMTAAMDKESMDNLSVVVISFANFTRFLESIEPQQGIASQQRQRSQQIALPLNGDLTPALSKSPKLVNENSTHASQPQIATTGGPDFHNNSRRFTQIQSLPAQSVQSSKLSNGGGDSTSRPLSIPPAPLTQGNARKRYAHVVSETRSSETQFKRQNSSSSQAKGQLANEAQTVRAKQRGLSEFPEPYRDGRGQSNLVTKSTTVATVADLMGEGVAGSAGERGAQRNAATSEQE